jgi:hypothetical protein
MFAFDTHSCFAVNLTCNFRITPFEKVKNEIITYSKWVQNFPRANKAQGDEGGGGGGRILLGVTQAAGR